LRVRWATLAQLAQAVRAFRSAPITPPAVQDLGTGLRRLTRELGRVALQDTLNSPEPDDPELLPEEVTTGGTRYRRRRKSPHRVGSTFGTLTPRRWLYEPREAGERCLSPLELLLGLPEGYYQEVPHKMRDPGRAGERLSWQRVLDYYHAAGYVAKLAEVLFGQGWQAERWSRRMRRALKQAGGLTRVLRPA
jgi:hypothetical protein